MRKTVTATEEVEVTRIESVTCNKCGRQLGEHEEHLSVDYEGGYDSKLGDGLKHSFDVCEPCLQWYMGTFNVPPDKEQRW